MTEKSTLEGSQLVLIMRSPRYSLISISKSLFEKNDISKYVTGSKLQNYAIKMAPLWGGRFDPLMGGVLSTVSTRSKIVF